MTEEELIECIDESKEEIIETTQNAAKYKDYFNEYTNPPEELIYMAANDTIESLKIIIEIQRYTIFKNKMKWFKSMSESRLKSGNMKLFLIDFMILLKNQIKRTCIKDQRIDKAFDNMIGIIEEEF